MADNTGATPPKWARYQIVLGAIYLNVGITLFIVQALDTPLWGVDLDFGYLPLTLLTVGASVTFGPVASKPVARFLAALLEKGG